MDAVIEALAFGVRTTIFLFVMLFRALSMLIGGGIGVASKASETDVQKQIRTKKPPYYFDHQISAVSCPKCKTENEDVQDRCYRCGEALTGQTASRIGMKTPTKIPAWAIAIWVLLALVGVLAVCCLCSVSLSTFRGSRAVSVYTPSSSQSTPNRQATASQNASGKKPRLIFSTNQQQVVAGEPFSVTVRLDPADYQIAEYRFSLQYPKDKISINHPKNDVIITEICEVDYSNAGVTGLGNYNVVHVEMYCKGDPYKGGETPIVIIPFETSEQASGMVRIEPEMVHSNILLRNQVFQETGRSTSNRENLLDPNIEPVIVGIMKKE